MITNFVYIHASFARTMWHMMTRIERFLKQYAWLLDGVWLCALSLYVLVGVAEVPFHGDESTQIYMGRDFHYQMIEGNLARVLFSETPTSPTEQHLRVLNGTLPKYVFGWVSASMGYTPSTLNEQWDWGTDWQGNQDAYRIPDQPLLIRARLTSALGLVFGMWGVFLLGVRWGGRSSAYLATLLFALHPALLLNGRRAMMEGYLIGFSVWVVVASVWFFNAQKARYALALGVFSGLAIASKHTGAFTVMAVYGALGLAWSWQAWRMPQERLRLARLLGGLVASGILALGVFYALNPSWWGDPIGRIRTVLVWRTELLNGQVSTFGGYADFGAQVSGFLRQAILPTAQYYEVNSWAEYIGAQIAHYEAILWGNGLFGVWRILWGGALLLGGSALLLGRVNRSVTWVMGIWGAVMVGLTLGATPIEWQRYYLPLLPVLALLGGLGARVMVEWSVRRANQDGLV